MGPVGSPDQAHLNGLWWYHGLWTSTQTPAATEPRTQTLSSEAAEAGTLPWPQEAAQGT